MRLFPTPSRPRAARFSVALARRARVALLLAAIATLVLPARPSGAGGARANRIVVLSTVDVKGKTSPCGCHVPKGGLSRLAFFADSLRSAGAPVLLVDGGGFFPEADTDAPIGAFMMDAMKVLGTDAIGVTERDLHFGRGFLVANARRTGVPLTCANLFDKATRQPLFPPYRMLKLGGVDVGVFAVTSDKIDLGPSRDSLMVEDPTEAATRTVAELRKKGATVVVLLSQIGKVSSEDLVTAVDGIDAVIIGRNVPLYQKGRTIKSTIASYGGEQGQYVGVTVLDLDATGRVKSADNTTVMLGPEIADSRPMLQTVKAFEDHFNDEKRRLEGERQKQSETGDGGTSSAELPADHYLGSEFCGRCHTRELAQWKDTRHAQAWQSLVDAKHETDEKCVSCHVLGYGKPGGFQTANDAPRLATVQCESCHGMGTSHEAFAKEKTKVAEATCRGCHTAETSPGFAMARFAPYVDHSKLVADLPALDVPRPMRTRTSGR